MPQSIPDIPKSRGRPSTGGRKPGVLVRLPEDELFAVDSWCSRWEQRTGKKITRPEALREMIRVVIRMGGLND